MTQAPSTTPPAGARARPRSNIYTVMTFMALLCLGCTLGFVLYRAKELFGSVGELFNLP